MRIKVKAKKGTYQSKLMLSLILILFGCVCAYFIYEMCFCANFDELLDRYGIAIPFVAVFGLVDIIGVIYFIKPSKPYKVLYESSYVMDDHTIYKLKLLVDKKAAVQTNYVYIDSKNKIDLIEGGVYTAYIKELNYQITAIDTNQTEASNTKVVSIDSSFKLFICMMMAVPVFMLALCIYGIIYYPKYWLAYIITSLFFIGMIGLLIHLYKNSKK